MVKYGLPLAFLITMASLMLPVPSEGIPLFARKYNVTCQTCHVSPPKLNAFGEAFRQGGYRMPGRTRANRTVPLAVWVSGRSDSPVTQQDVNQIKTYLNRIEVISAGNAGTSWLSYFVEWRPLSFDVRGDGTLRDRSGRFEDIFLTASSGRFSVTAGQFRQIDQVDVSLRPGLSEPIALSASLAGSGNGSSRQRSLRGFSPSGRSPSVRLAMTEPLRDNWYLTGSIALPLPGELSIPLTKEARIEASNEIEAELKGVVVESFAHRGLTSFGGHVFYDHSDRYLANAVAAGSHGAFHWTGVLGMEKQFGNANSRWSMEGGYYPHYFFGVGGRVENRGGDNAPVAFLPYLNAHFPGSKYTVRLTLEQRFQKDRGLTMLELGVIF
jgi:hypothetical protein